MRILVLYFLAWVVLPVAVYAVLGVAVIRVAEALGLRNPPPSPRPDPLAVEALQPRSNPGRRHYDRH